MRAAAAAARARARGRAEGRAGMDRHCRSHKNGLCPRCRCPPQSAHQQSEPSRSNTLPACLAFLFCLSARSSNIPTLSSHLRCHPRLECRSAQEQNPVDLWPCSRTISLVREPSASCPAVRSKQGAEGHGTPYRATALTTVLPSDITSEKQSCSNVELSSGRKATNPSTSTDPPTDALLAAC